MLLLGVLDHGRLAVTVVERSWDVLGEAQFKGGEQSVAKANDDVICHGTVFIIILLHVADEVDVSHNETFTDLNGIGEPSCKNKTSAERNE